MTVNKRSDGSIDVMVSQPGGTFVTLLGFNTHTTRSMEARGLEAEEQAAG